MKFLTCVTLLALLTCVGGRSPEYADVVFAVGYARQVRQVIREAQSLVNKGA
jgi:hypothetical protein